MKRIVASFMAWNLAIVAARQTVANGHSFLSMHSVECGKNFQYVAKFVVMIFQHQYA
jgi:hypothetical protein